MRIFLGIVFLVIGVPTLLISLGTLFGQQMFESGSLFVGAPFTMLGLYCLFGPEG